MNRNLLSLHSILMLEGEPCSHSEPYEQDESRRFTGISGNETVIDDQCGWSEVESCHDIFVGFHQRWKQERCRPSVSASRARPPQRGAGSITECRWSARPRFSQICEGQAKLQSRTTQPARHHIYKCAFVLAFKLVAGVAC